MRKAGILSLVALGAVLLVPGTSDAQRRGGGGRGGSGGNWSGSRGGYSGGHNGYYGNSGWGNGWGWGGIALSIGTPGYYGGYGYGGYRSPYYGGSYYGSSYSYDTPSYAYSQPYSTTTIPQTSFYSDPGAMSANTANFVVRVPDPNAEVWFQNYRTQQNGVVRQYQSEALDPNSNYTFQVRARWMQNGQMMDQTRQVPAHAGQTFTVDFTTGNMPSQSVGNAPDSPLFNQTNQSGQVQINQPGSTQNVQPGTFQNNQRGTFPNNQPGSLPNNQTGAPRVNQPGNAPINQQDGFPNNQPGGVQNNNQQPALPGTNRTGEPDGR